MSTIPLHTDAYARYYRDAYGPHVEHGRVQEFMTAAVHAEFGEHLPLDRSASVLDFAAGAGLLTRSLREMGYLNVTAVDISPDQVAAGRRFGIDVICVDGREHCRAHPDTYQCILASDIIEHFTKDDARSVLGDLHSALSRGGRLIVRTPNASAPFASRSRWRDVTHECLYTEESLYMLLRIAGFNVETIYGRDPIPSTLRGLAHRCLRGTYRSFWRGFAIAEWGIVDGRRFPLDRNLIAVATKA